MERFRDQHFAHFSTVGVRRIDEINAHVDRALQHLLRFLPILRPTPNAVARNSHRSETQSIDWKISADLKHGRFLSVRCRSQNRRCAAQGDDRAATKSETNKSAPCHLPFSSWIVHGIT